MGYQLFFILLYSLCLKSFFLYVLCLIYLNSILIAGQYKSQLDELSHDMIWEFYVFYSSVLFLEDILLNRNLQSNITIIS